MLKNSNAGNTTREQTGPASTSAQLPLLNDPQNAK